jgi:hypothetical protein
MLLVCGLTALFGGVHIWRYPGALFLGDGWIFLQYARNLATGHGWSFNAGEISFGATSPAWVVVLAGVFRLSPAHFEIAAQCGGLVCFAIAVGILFTLLTRIEPAAPISARLMSSAFVGLMPFSGLFYAISAMETGLYLLVFLGFVFLLQRQLAGQRVPDYWFGVCAGVLFFIRPEAVLCAPLYLLVVRRLPGQGWRIVSVAGWTFLLIAPWIWFTHARSGSWLPTSGTGRLYGRLSLVFPDLALRDYLRLSILERTALIPTVIHTQFIAHPVMVLFVLVPFAIVLLKWAVARWTRRSDPLLTFLASYCVVVLASYMVWQPLLFQRYFVAFLPAAILCTFRELSAVRRQRLLIAAAVTFIAATNFMAVPYYKDHVEMNSAVVELFRSPALQSKQPCRLAAEPLGYAGYFTPCHVIDLGGLIEPEIWQYWRDGRSSVDFALDRHADFIVSDGLDPERFTLLDRRLIWGIYAVESKR